MILYFSGTGNSQYVAHIISKEIHDDVLNLFDKIRTQDYTALKSSKPWIIVAPTYAWRIPRIVNEWLKKTPLHGNKDIYFVMTCAGSKGNAGYYLKEWCQDKGLQYKGCTQIIMPENYIALYDTTSPELIPEILEQAYRCVLKSVYYIKENKSFPESSITLKDKVSSGIVNDLFYPLFVQAKKFYGNDNCISCGKCEKLCPLSNIKLIEGQPIWGNHCTHCMACISRCPKGAIEYGKKSVGKPRYHFEAL